MHGHVHVPVCTMYMYTHVHMNVKIYMQLHVHVYIEIRQLINTKQLHLNFCRRENELPQAGLEPAYLTDAWKHACTCTCTVVLCPCVYVSTPALGRPGGMLPQEIIVL